MPHVLGVILPLVVIVLVLGILLFIVKMQSVQPSIAVAWHTHIA